MSPKCHWPSAWPQQVIPGNDVAIPLSRKEAEILVPHFLKLSAWPPAPIPETRWKRGLTTVPACRVVLAAWQGPTYSCGSPFVCLGWHNVGNSGLHVHVLIGTVTAGEINTQVRTQQNWKGDTALALSGQAAALPCCSRQQTDFMSRTVMQPLKEKFQMSSVRYEYLPFDTKV